jgi:hypothetical protein
MEVAMSFAKILDSEFDQIRYARSQAEGVTKNAARLSVILGEQLAESYPKNTWGVSFIPSEDGLSASIDTPFGKARAVVSVGLNKGEVKARYIFEKLVTNDAGAQVYRPVWAVRISQEGFVFDDDGDLRILSLQELSPLKLSNGVTTIALSFLYAIAADLGYSAAIQ